MFDVDVLLAHVFPVSPARINTSARTLGLCSFRRSGNRERVAKWCRWATVSWSSKQRNQRWRPSRSTILTPRDLCLLCHATPLHLALCLSLIFPLSTHCGRLQGAVLDEHALQLKISSKKLGGALRVCMWSSVGDDVPTLLIVVCWGFVGVTIASGLLFPCSLVTAVPLIR